MTEIVPHEGWKLSGVGLQAVKEDANASGESMRSLVLNALEAHYSEVPT